MKLYLRVPAERRPVCQRSLEAAAGVFGRRHLAVLEGWRLGLACCVAADECQIQESQRAQ